MLFFIWKWCNPFKPLYKPRRQRFLFFLLSSRLPSCCLRCPPPLPALPLFTACSKWTSECVICSPEHGFTRLRYSRPWGLSSRPRVFVGGGGYSSVTQVPPIASSSVFDMFKYHFYLSRRTSAKLLLEALGQLEKRLAV